VYCTTLRGKTETQHATVVTVTKNGIGQSQTKRDTVFGFSDLDRFSDLDKSNCWRERNGIMSFESESDLNSEYILGGGTNVNEKSLNQVPMDARIVTTLQ